MKKIENPDKYWKNQQYAGDIRRIFLRFLGRDGEKCRAVSGRSYCLLSVSVLNCDLQKIKRRKIRRMADTRSAVTQDAAYNPAVCGKTV